MEEKSKKSGHHRFGRRRTLRVRLSEQAEKASDHFFENFIARIKNLREVRLWVTEWGLLILTVLTLAIAQAAWYANTYEKKAFVAGGVYTEATLGKVNSMNPLYAVTSSEKTLGELLFLKVVSPDITGHMKNELAESVMSDNTGKVWTLKLKKDLKWSDGEPITIDDVLYTIDLIDDPSAKTTIAVNFKSLKIKRVDDLTAEFTLPSVYMDFAESLEFPVLPKHILGEVAPSLVYENAFSTQPVGSGPFVLNAVQNATVANNNYLQTIYLNRNENYPFGKVKLDGFTLKTYETTDDILVAMKSNEVSATAELTGIETGFTDKNIMSHSSQMNAGVYAFINTETVPLVSVRQAIQHGVDIEKVREGFDDARKLDYPFLERQGESLVFPEIGKHDVNKAKELLEGSNLRYDDNGRLIDSEGELVTLTIAVKNRPVISDVAERFRKELEGLGFTAIVVSYDEKQDFFTTVVQPRSYDILIYEIDLGIAADPFVYYGSTQATGAGWNFSNYKNSISDNALLTARTTTNKSLLKVKYETFLKRWVTDVPAIGIYQSNMDYYYNKNVQTYSENNILTDSLDRFVDIENWAAEQKNVNVTP